jgi:hypothetical protein
MDEAKSLALREYEEALTFFLTHSPETQDGDFDLRMRIRLYDAGREIEKHGLRGTPEYNEAVLRADRNASVLRHGPGGAIGREK